uniref:Uncharacterized protein n=1 Tax=Megaviridae environmental sample TaxID=1737588 RepID=A0A5J6VJ16_9VIRU|nr:MAG: hypothetical protein [Megaviridae environmental sample]
MTDDKYYDKTTYLNIDSSHRQRFNIPTYGDNYVLNSNPLYFTEGSNTIRIDMQHNITVDDNITIDNVFHKSFTGKFTLSIDNNIIYIDGIEDSLEFINMLKLERIFTITGLIGSSTINPISNNYIFTYLPVDIFNQQHDVKIIDDRIYIDVLLQTFKQEVIESTFTITLNSIAGIPINDITTCIPSTPFITNQLHAVSQIDANSIYFTSSYTATYTTHGGGNHVKVMILKDITNGFPYASEFTYQVNRALINVKSVSLVSSEVPHTIKTFNTPMKINFKLIYDLQHVFTAELEPACYTIDSLVEEFETQMNKLTFDIYTYKFIVSKDKQQRLTIESFLGSIINFEIVGVERSPDTQLVTRLDFKRPNLVFYKTTDIIIIENSNSIFGIPAELLNKRHTNFTITEDNIMIHIPDYKPVNETYDTIGSNVWAYKQVDILYIKSESKEFIDLFNLHHLPDNIAYSKAVGTLSPKLLPWSYFNVHLDMMNHQVNEFILAKIQIDSEYAKYLFNTYTPNIITFDPPLDKTAQLKFSIKSLNNNLIDLENNDISFTLKVVESIRIE